MKPEIKTKPEAVTLLPCPFCGGEAWAGGWKRNGGEPECVECGSKAIDDVAWNRRNPAAEPAPQSFWRLLEEGEVIEEGDQFESCPGSWRASELVGTPAHWGCSIRRRVTLPPAAAVAGELAEMVERLLLSADALWEQNRLGHDWAEACDDARALLAKDRPAAPKEGGAL